MRPVFGTYREGRIVLDAPVDWPEGSRVAVAATGAGPGLAEADWPDGPETRATLLARLDAIEPLELSPQDEAEIEAARQDVRGASLRAVRRRMGLSP
jgi:hypothetical protein